MISVDRQSYEEGQAANKASALREITDAAPLSSSIAKHDYATTAAFLYDAAATLVERGVKPLTLKAMKAAVKTHDNFKSIALAEHEAALLNKQKKTAELFTERKEKR